MGDSCDVVCVQGNKAATCRERARLYLNHGFLDEPHACMSAIDKVVEDCPSCSGCSPDLAGCKLEITTTFSSKDLGSDATQLYGEVLPPRKFLRFFSIRIWHFTSRPVDY